MLIVADTSPINYLVLIGIEHVLLELYGGIFVPEQVMNELRDPASPQPVADWIARLPAWVRIEQADVRMIPDHIGIGERAAIALATQLKTDRLLLDDREARALAERMGLRVAGTLAVVVDAARAGLIDPGRVLADLQRTSFRASVTLLLEVLALCQRPSG